MSSHTNLSKEKFFRVKLRFDSSKIATLDTNGCDNVEINLVLLNFICEKIPINILFILY